MVIQQSGGKRKEILFKAIELRLKSEIKYGVTSKNISLYQLLPNHFANRIQKRSYGSSKDNIIWYLSQILVLNTNARAEVKARYSSIFNTALCKTSNIICKENAAVFAANEYVRKTVKCAVDSRTVSWVNESIDRLTLLASVHLNPSYYQFFNLHGQVLLDCWTLHEQKIDTIEGYRKLYEEEMLRLKRGDISYFLSNSRERFCFSYSDVFS